MPALNRRGGGEKGHRRLLSSPWKLGLRQRGRALKQTVGLVLESLGKNRRRCLAFRHDGSDHCGHVATKIVAAASIRISLSNN